MQARMGFISGGVITGCIFCLEEDVPKTGGGGTYTRKFTVYVKISISVYQASQ